LEHFKISISTSTDSKKRRIYIKGAPFNGAWKLFPFETGLENLINTGCMDCGISLAGRTGLRGRQRGQLPRAPAARPPPW